MGFATPGDILKTEGPEAYTGKYWLAPDRRIPFLIGARTQISAYAKRKNKPTFEIIGVKEPSLRYLARNAGGYVATGLTVTYFDTATRPDEAHLLLTNSAGEDRYLYDLGIFGKPVVRFSGTEGWVHDWFKSAERIRTHGPVVFELENPYICALDQVNKLADWWWKYCSTAKHDYAVALHGACHWLEVGEWYTLKIGGAGEREYIDSVVQCMQRSVERSGASGANSMAVFREIQQNWVATSGYAARLRVAGGRGRNREPGPSLTVGSSSYIGVADIYCEGESDHQVTINAAVALVAGKGGTLTLTPGDYVVGSAPIALASDMELVLQPGVRIVRGGTSTLLKAAGSAGAEIENLTIRGPGVIEEDPSYGSELTAVAFSYCNRLHLSGFRMHSSANTAGLVPVMWLQNCNSVVVESLQFVDCLWNNLLFNTVQGTVRDLEFFWTQELPYDTGWFGLMAWESPALNISGLDMHDLIGACEVLGIWVGAYGGSDVLIENCRFRNLAGHLWALPVYAIVLDVDRSTVRNCHFDSILGCGAGEVAYYTLGVGVDVGGKYNRVVGCDFNNVGLPLYVMGTENQLIENTYADCGQMIDYSGAEIELPRLRGRTLLGIGCTVVSNSTEEQYGATCLAVSATAALAIASLTGAADSGALFGLTPGESYRFVAWAKVLTGGPAPGNVKLLVRQWDTAKPGGAGWVDTYSEPLSASDVYEELSLEFTLGAATVTGVMVCAALIDSSGKTAYFDSFRFHPIGRNAGNAFYGNHYDAGTGTVIREATS